MVFLIGMNLERDVLDKNDVLRIAYNNHFTVPDLLFEICCFEGKWHIHGMPSRVYPYYWYEESKISFFKEKTNKKIYEYV